MRRQIVRCIISTDIWLVTRTFLCGRQKAFCVFSNNLQTRKDIFALGGSICHKIHKIHTRQFSLCKSLVLPTGLMKLAEFANVKKIQGATFEALALCQISLQAITGLSISRLI